MANFVITFPPRDRAKCDGWVSVINARDLDQVKNFADHEYKDYSLIISEDDFTDGYYPQGCLEIVDFNKWHDYVT